MELIVLFLLVALLFVGEMQLYKWKWHRKLNYQCKFSTDEAYEGDEIELIETVTNAKLLPLAWAKVEITTSKWLSFADTQSLVAGETRYVPSFFVLKSHHRVVRRWKVRCLRRGTYTVDKNVLVTTDLLGQSIFSLPVEVNTVITVLPRPRETVECLVSPKGMSGEVIVPRRLFTDPFFVNGVREYTPHDAANRIHWAATAKEDRIMVRSNDCTSDQTVTIVLNMQTRVDEGSHITDADDIERGIVAAATAVAETAGRGLPTRLLCNGGTADHGPLSTSLGAGEEFALELLHALALLQITKSENFRTFAPQLRKHIVSSDIVMISSYADDFIFQFARDCADSGIHFKLLLTRAYHFDALPSDVDIALFEDDGVAVPPAEDQTKEETA